MNGTLRQAGIPNLIPNKTDFETNQERPRTLHSDQENNQPQRHHSTKYTYTKHSTLNFTENILTFVTKIHPDRLIAVDVSTPLTPTGRSFGGKN